MVLSYNNNTPQANQSVASTQAPILTNFQSLDSAFNGQTGGGSGGGNFTTYSIQNTTASFVSKPVNPIGILYSLVGGGSAPELAWINNKNAVGAGPFTGLQITNSSLTTTLGSGFMPGGVQIRAGSGTANGLEITFADGGFPMALISVVCTVVSALSANLQITDQCKTSFSATCSTGSPTINYVAVGY